MNPNLMNPMTMATMAAVTLAIMFTLNRLKAKPYFGPLIQAGAVNPRNVIPFPGGSGSGGSDGGTIADYGGVRTL